jgi:hypothetical protein
MVSYYKASALLSILLPATSTVSASANKTPNPNKDLDLLKFRGFEHHYKNLRTNSGVEHARLHASLRDDLETLESEKCANLMFGVESSLTEKLKSMDEDIINYTCNGIKLKENLAKLDRMELDKAEQKEPCTKAVEEIETTVIKKSDLASKDACAMKVQSMLDGVRGVQDLPEVHVDASIATSTAVALAVLWWSW